MVRRSMSGRGSVVVGTDGARSFVRRLRAESPLCLRAPRRTPGSAAWIMAGSLGGGLVDGDALSLVIEVEGGAHALLTTQASTKVYRGRGRTTIEGRIGAGGALVVAPDPLVPFADAACTQHQSYALDHDASLVLVDVVGGGRAARGERWAFSALDTRLVVTRGGERVVDEGLGLFAADGPIAERLEPFEALATLVLLGPLAGSAAALADVVQRPWVEGRLVVSASPLAGGALLRVAARSMAEALLEVRRVVGPALATLGDPFARQPGAPAVRAAVRQVST